MGLHSDDGRIRHSLELARRCRAWKWPSAEVSIPGAHPNTARLELTGRSGRRAAVQGASVGGRQCADNVHQRHGRGLHRAVQHYPRAPPGQAGAIAAVTQFMAGSGVNIGNFRLSRERRGGEALMTIEVDGDVSDALMEELARAGRPCSRPCSSGP